MTRWFISDTHFGHENIIKYQNRPFSCAKEMDEIMIARWNEVVKPEDHISHLGDVTMARGGRVIQEAFIRLIKRLNGHKRLYLGNHDHLPVEVYLEAGFEKIYATWQDEAGILCSHIPIHPSAIGSATANVHGHIHGNKSPEPIIFEDTDKGRSVRPYVNICVEVTDYHPISFEEVQQRIRDVKLRYGVS